MRHFVVTLLLAVVTATQAWAAGATAVYIWMKDGSKTVLQLSEKPVMTFGQEEMRVTTTNTVVSFAFDQLKNITYRDVTDGVDALKDGERAFCYDGQTMTFRAGDEALKVMVVRLDGAKVRQLSVRPMESVTIAADELPRGNYVVVVNGVTYKIQKP